jgi:hypothetical protein
MQKSREHRELFFPGSLSSGLPAVYFLNSQLKVARKRINAYNFFGFLLHVSFTYYNLWVVCTPAISSL